MLSVEFGVENPLDPGNAKEYLVKISGFVTDFTDINGEPIDRTNPWIVELKEGEHAPAQEDNLGEFLSGSTTGEGTEDGEWNYQYFGQLDGTATARPTVVGGGFDATFPNGKAAGAFAATLD